MHSQSERFQVNGEFRNTSNPENQLLAAVMFRAMCDATNAACDRPGEHRQIRRSALNWLCLYKPLKPDHSAFSFWWICDHLNVDPHLIKEFVLDHIKRGCEIVP